MYKFLLATRYLRTRYIALASVISVTLGVATLIIVNSVMAGFQEEMYNRLHGILSDIVVESHSLEGIPDPDHLLVAIRENLGEDLECMTTTIQVPAMMGIPYRDGSHSRPISLIGVDKETYAKVSDISQYLQHPDNRERLTFDLHEGNYDSRIDAGGWEHRRTRALMQKAYEEQQKRHQEFLRQQNELQRAVARSGLSKDPSEVKHSVDETTGAAGVHPDDSVTDSSVAASPIVDPFATGAEEEVQMFDPETEQHPGIVVGIAIGSVRQKDADGQVREFFLCRPGDDVTVTFPSAGTPPKPIHNNFTVVDFYESKMSEYDSSIAFIEIDKLQMMRGMGSAVTAIQIKLAPGADLNACRDKLRAAFPPESFRCQVQSWQDLQGPLLAAVQLETTLLNILLFLIIAVAGFGILATFFMIVVEKTRDIGILKSLGASCRGVMTIFLSYGLSLGTVGSGVGMILGLLFVANINTIARTLEWITGRELFDPTVYYFQSIPTIVEPWTVVWIVLGAIGIAVAASILPALRASRLHPVEALRYE